MAHQEGIFRGASRARNGIMPALCGVLAALVVALLPPGAAQGQNPPARPLPPGITPETYQAVERGLAYLARTQDRQGSWSNRNRTNAYPVAMTSLAALALLMDGNTTTQGRYAANVDRAARYVMSSVTTSGLISRPELEPRPMYGHGFAVLFLGELHGMTEDPERAQQIHNLLRQGVDLIARAQSPLGGWIYTPDARSDEGSVTITQVQALRSCRNAGIAVPKDVIDDAMQYLVTSQNDDGGIRYRLGTPGPSRPPLSAAAVCCWFNAGEYDNRHARQALEHAKKNLTPEAVAGHDYYAHLYLAQALYIGRDPYWDEYFQRRRDVMLAQQQDDGSFRSTDGVGDIYDTAIAMIILQLPFNRLPIMQR